MIDSRTEHGIGWFSQRHYDLQYFSPCTCIRDQTVGYVSISPIDKLAPGM